MDSYPQRELISTSFLDRTRHTLQVLLPAIRSVVWSLGLYQDLKLALTLVREIGVRQVMYTDDIFVYM